MLVDIIPKLPMRNKNVTIDYYLTNLGFKVIGNYQGYLILRKENIEIHFFEFKDLRPKENYGQVYIRNNDIENLYKFLLANKTEIHANGTLSTKAWGQKDFSILDPDTNLLIFGQSI